MTATPSKADLRTTALAKRDALGEEQRISAAQALAKRSAPFAIEPGMVVSGYSPIRSEIDPAGHRIGYGAGHYDFTLEHLRKVKAITAVGVAFAVQQIKAVPAQPHDVALDFVLTEKKVFDFRS